jgi:transcriptional regulator with XRE-family HTH domain
MNTLRQLLKSKGIKQQVIAEALGINQSAVGRYDDLTRRPVSDILKIADATGIAVDELLGVKINGNTGVVNTGIVGGDVHAVTGDGAVTDERKAMAALKRDNERQQARIAALERDVMELRDTIRQKDDAIIKLIDKVTGDG